MKHLILVFGFLAAFAASASAQSDLQRAKAGLPADAARTLEQTVANARSRGLPTAPLIDKALEGIAKHAPPNAIVEAVRRRADLLARADAALRPAGLATTEGVTAVADVMQRGVSEDVVKRAAKGRRQNEPLDLSLHTLAELIERGVPVDVAFDVLSSWRSRHGSEEELREMPAAVARLVGQGESPRNAARAVAERGRDNKGKGHGREKSEEVSKRGKGQDGPPVPPGGQPSNRGKGKGKGE